MVFPCWGSCLHEEMMRKLWIARIAALACIVSTPSFGQTWEGYKPTPATESPIEVKLKGWGKETIRSSGYDKGNNSNNTGEVYYYTIRSETADYKSFIGIYESTVFRQWNQDTLQNYAGRHFKNVDLSFGDLDDIYNGRAQFKFIPVGFTENGKKNNCAMFRSTWDYLSSVGWLCTKSEKNLNIEAVKTFITHIGFKKYLTPQDEGELPPAS